MRVVALSNLACPLDGLSLNVDGAVARCPRGHSFDRAREGYWNLLPVQHKASADPGDSKDMVAARQRSLGAQHFRPIADAVFAMARVAAHETRRGTGPFSIVDAGCGEGSYLARLAALATADPGDATWHLAGFDVSKWAVRVAARQVLVAADGGRVPAPVTWLVANSKRPPFPAGSVDLILCLFGFAVWEGFKAVQAPGGLVLLADPGPDHLIELRALIYPAVTRSPPPALVRAEAAGYRLVREDAARFRFHLVDRSLIADLVAMTPHAHRMGEAGRAALAKIEKITLTGDVVLRLLRFRK